MKKLCALFVILALLLCGCGAGEDAETSEYSDALDKAQQIAVISADTSKVVNVLDTKEEFNEFSEALKTEEWEPAEAPQDSKELGSFALSQEKTIKLGQTDTDGELYNVGKIVLYDSPYIEFEIAGLGMSFKIPEDTAKYLKGYFESR